MGNFFFFFAGAPAPPSHYVAPPLETREKAMNQGWRVTADTGQNTSGTVAENNEISVSKAVVSPNSITDFEAQLQEIDEVIHDDGRVQNSSQPVKVMNVESDTDLVIMETDSAGQQEKPQEETPLFQHKAHYVEQDSLLFTPRWANSNSERKSKKSRHSTTKGGLTDGKQEVGPKAKGTWTRLTRSKTESEQDAFEKEGSKRKLPSDLGEEHLLEHGKKHKLEDKTKSFSMLLASEFGAAEVAKQPRQTP